MSDKSFWSVDVWVQFSDKGMPYSVFKRDFYGIRDPQLNIFEFDSFVELEDWLSHSASDTVPNGIRYERTQGENGEGILRIPTTPSVFGGFPSLVSNEDNFTPVRIVFLWEDKGSFFTNMDSFMEFALDHPQEFKVFMDENNLKDGEDIREYCERMRVKKCAQSWNEVLDKLKENA